MASLYTSDYGATSQGSSLQSLTDTLKAITGTTDPFQAGQVQLATQGLQMGQNYPQYIQNAQNTMTQQSGIPSLQGGQQDMGKIFQMWSADQNLSSKYASPSLVPGGTTGGAFTGFTDPGINTQAMGAVPQSATNISNLLAGAIGTEQSNVGLGMQAASQNYQSALNTLLGLGNMLGGLSQAKQTTLYQQKQLDLENRKLDLEYGIGTGGVFGKSGSGDSSIIDNKSLTKRQKLKLLDDKIINAPNITIANKLQLLRDNIAKQGQLNTAEETKAGVARSALSIIDNVSKVMDTNISLQNVMGDPIKAKALKWAMANGVINWVGPTLGLDDEAMSTLSDLNTFMGAGDRDIIGGRLSGYMIGIFGPSFPSLDKNVAVNKDLFEKARERITNQLGILADNKNLSGYQDLAGFEDYQPYKPLGGAGTYTGSSGTEYKITPL